MQPTTEWTCLNCGKNFKMGEWECVPGTSIMHTVARKDYWMDDAPTDPSNTAQRASRTFVHNVPPEKTIRDKSSGEAVRVPGGVVIFSRGHFDTTNPEQQYWIEFHGVTCTKERWQEVYFSANEKKELAELDIRNKQAQAERTVKEANDLLAQVKAREAKVAEAKGGKPHQGD